MRLALAVAMWVGLFGCRDILEIEDRPEVPATDASSTEPIDDAAARSSFCTTLQPSPQRCWDFERGGLLDGFRSADQKPYPGLVGGGALDEVVDSSGRHLLASRGATVGAAARSAAMVLFDVPNSPRVAVKAKVAVVTEDIPVENQLTIMSIVYGDEGAIMVYRDDEGTSIAVVPDGKGAHFPPWPVGTAHTIGFTVRAPSGSAAGWVRGSIDGANGPELAIPERFAKVQRPLVMLGASAIGVMGEAQVAIDDVILYWGAAE